VWILAVLCVWSSAFAPAVFGGKQLWMNTSLSPDERASLVVKEMTLDEDLASARYRHGRAQPHEPAGHSCERWAGYVVGVPRLGIPDIQMSDAAYGVRASAERTLLHCAAFRCGGAASWMKAQYGA
jgi:beta-glucosidase